jgi:hypothetical protein
MTAKQTAKHITDNAAKILTPTEGSSLDAAEPTPDGLGAWQGGIAHRSIDGAKAKPQRTGDTKNTPGTDYASKITHRQDRDFNEFHVEENGDVLLYNVKTDAWDIKGDSADMPLYEDENGKTWGYNCKTGKWDVPVYEEWTGIAPEEPNVEPTPIA